MAKTRRQQIEDMLADDPDDTFLRYGLAMEYLGESQPEEAVRCFRDLIAIDPRYPPAYLQAGQVLAQLGRTEEARAMFQTGIVAARQVGDLHAAGEMEGMLASLG